MEQFSNILKNFKNLKILVVGDVMLDEYLLGSVTGISDEGLAPLLEVEEKTYTPGGAANVAHNVSSLGGKAFLVGIIGSGDGGKILKEILKKKEINSEGVFIDEKRKTTTITRVVTKNQEIVQAEWRDKDPISKEMEEKIINFIKGQIKNINSVIICDMAIGVITPRLSRSIIQIAKEQKVLCLVDPIGTDYSKYKNCDIIKPNEKELAEALNIKMENESQFLQAGKTLLYQVMCNSVLATRAEKGMTLFKQGEAVFHFPAVNKERVTISGAGDTAAAAFILALAGGADLKQAVTIASHASGIVVGKAGTAVASLKELKESFNIFSA